MQVDVVDVNVHSLVSLGVVSLAVQTHIFTSKQPHPPNHQQLNHMPCHMPVSSCTGSCSSVLQQKKNDDARGMRTQYTLVLILLGPPA